MYNGVLYWSPLAQAQYAAAQGDGSTPNIALNDVVFAIHAMALTGVHLFQIAIYDVCWQPLVPIPKAGTQRRPLMRGVACCGTQQRGSQKFSYFSITQVALFVAVSYLWSMLAAAGGAQVYELLLYCSYVKLWLTLVKYCSQVPHRPPHSLCPRSPPVAHVPGARVCDPVLTAH
jgi:hypothetical protein